MACRTLIKLLEEHVNDCNPKVPEFIKDVERVCPDPAIRMQVDYLAKKFKEECECSRK